jgi:hypothetical protein
MRRQLLEGSEQPSTVDRIRACIGIPAGAADPTSHSVRLMEPLTARKIARTANPYASIIFLTPEAAAGYAAAGLPKGRMGYFAGRAAPMGPVPAEVVIATFYNFQPDLVRSAIPEAWSYASPATILEHRLVAVDESLRRVLGADALGQPEIKEAADLARRAAEACAPEGRALFAGHASLPWPNEPHMELWHALTLLREHRGDGHLMALQVGGYSGCQAILMHQAVGEVPANFAASRGWSDEQWAEASDDLRARGLLDADGVATDAGRASREAIEHQTDLLALAPWERLGEEGTTRLRTLIQPLTATIAAEVFPGLR